MAESRQSSGTPSGGNPEGSDLRTIAGQIEGLLDDDGQVTDGRPSRAVDPDQYEDTGEAPTRDERGRFRKKAAEAPEETDDVEIVEQTDIEAEDDQLAAGDDQTEDTETGDTDEDLAASAEDTPETEDADTEGAIETLAELANAIEFPIEEMKETLSHTFNAAGEEVTVTLKELEKGYQRDADYRKGTAENAEFRRAAEMSYTDRMQQFDQQHQFTAATINATEQLLAAKLNDPSLATLRESNPAEWNARRAELGEEISQVQQARANAMQHYAEFSQQQKTELKDRETQYLKERMPDFDKDDAAIARNTMESLGYIDTEIANIFDHRLVLGAIELANLRDEVAALRQEKSQAKDAVKRVTKTIPKLQRPGKQTAPQTQRRTIRRDQLAKAKTRAKKSGNLQDAASVIEQMGII